MAWMLAGWDADIFLVDRQGPEVETAPIDAGLEVSASPERRSRTVSFHYSAYRGLMH